MFGDHQIITFLDKEDIENKLQEYIKAKYEIQRLCLDEKNEQFFQIRTRVAKETLIQKAQEFITSILNKCSQIVKKNITRLGDEY